MYRNEQEYFNIKAEISLPNIQENIDSLKSNLRSGTKIMAVVKADAYGLGAVKVSSFIESSIFQFGVATIQEAIELRNSGITKPIAVFAAPTEDNASAFYTYNIQPILSGLDQFELFQDPIDAHIQFNTGMHRFGIAPDHLHETDRILKKSPHINPVGICSHFATASDPNSSDVTAQFEVFNSISEQATFAHENVLSHIANTGAALFYPETSCDMARPGIGLYGGYPGDTETGSLKQVLTLKSMVIHAHAIKKGERVSYDLTWKAPSDGTVVILPAGYADGISRKQSDKMKIRIGDKIFRQAGRVTMDYILIFVPESHSAPAVGTEATLMGADHDLDLTSWAKRSETISYEVLTSLNTRRILKTYLKERS